MFKKILCPIDFQEASLNAAEYAANLGKIFNAEVKFVTIQRVLPVMEHAELETGGAKSETKEKAPSDRLRELSSTMNEKFGVQSEIEVIVTSDSLEKAINAFAEKDDLIVIGSNGIDDVFEYIFGTNAYNVAKTVRCAVWVIPKNEKFHGISDLTWAWDYTSKNISSFRLLEVLMSSFKPKTTFLHISEERTGISTDVFRAMKGEILSLSKEDSDISFKQLFTNNIPGAIEDYVRDEPTDLLVLTCYDRGLIRNMFHGTIMKKLVESVNVPVLILRV